MLTGGPLLGFGQTLTPHSGRRRGPARAPEGILARSMSQENVEIVRAATEAMLAGDIETALGAVAKDIEWHGAVGGFDEGRVVRGHDEVVAGYGEYFASWESIELRAERYIDAGEEEV